MSDLPSDVRSTYRRLQKAGLFYAMATIFATMILYGVALDFGDRQRRMVGLCACLVIPVVLFVDWLTLKLHYRVIERFFNEEQVSPNPESLAESALVRALNLPQLTVIRIMCLHGPISVIGSTLFGYLLLNSEFDAGFQPWQFVFLWCSLFITVPGHAIFEFFAVHRIMRPTVRWLQPVVPGLNSSHPKLIGVGIRTKLLFCCAFINVIPLAVLGFTSVLKMEQVILTANIPEGSRILNPMIVWNAAIVLAGSILAVAISVVVTADVSRSAKRLVRSMRLVEKGDFGAHIDIDSTDDFAAIHDGFNKMTRSIVEGNRVKTALDKYVSPDLARSISLDGVELGGRSVHASVLFADIRGFTNLSEALTALEVVELLNHYFSAMEPAIRLHGGWINKFGGDSLLAVFGVVAVYPDHANRAVLAALEMRRALSELNRRRESSGKQTIRIGIGVHCGYLVAGNVGSEQRMEFTVIGDAVNTASRLQTLTKDFQTDLLISAEVRQALTTQLPLEEKVVEAKGKSLPFRAFVVN